jgi:hypothetical protein
MPNRQVQIEFEPGALVLQGEGIREDRRARLYFGNIGAEPLDDGWRCVRRRGTLDGLLLQIIQWLQRNSWEVVGVGEAHAVLEREEERRNSFGRTSE